MSIGSWQFVALVAFIIWYLSTQAGRLDRLHHRIDVAAAALDTHLARRSGVVAELAATDAFDVVTSAMLAQAAHDALAAGELVTQARLDAESDLSDLLISTFSSSDNYRDEDPLVQGLLEELTQACARVSLSHKFHSDAVTDCAGIRQQLLVRIFFLAGRASLPQPLLFEDEVPAGLAN